MFFLLKPKDWSHTQKPVCITEDHETLVKVMIADFWGPDAFKNAEVCLEALNKQEAPSTGWGEG